MENILFIEAHPDDIIISAGGTLLKLLAEKKNVVWVTLTNPGSSRMEEQYNIIKKFPNIIYHNLNHQDGFARCDSDTIRLLDELIKIHNIDTIFTHWRYSTHQDHQTAYKLSMIVGRRGIKNIYMYETVAPSQISFPSFVAHKFFNIDDYFFEKMKLLREYESQVKKYGIDWVKAIEGLARFRGYLANCVYAEAVQIIKEVE